MIKDIIIHKRHSWSAREIAEAEHRAGGLQWSESLDGGPPPPIAGIDDDAGRQEKSGRP